MTQRPPQEPHTQETRPLAFEPLVGPSVDDTGLGPVPGAAPRAAGSGPNAKWRQPKKKRSYLLRPDYQAVGLDEIFNRTEEATVAYLADVRWRALGVGVQVCPRCGTVDTHYRCQGNRGWKCKSKVCGRKFTVFSGTRVHGMKMTAKTFVSILFHFMEAKDSISSREISGLHGLNHQTVHVLTLKLREAIRDTMLAEPPLTGHVHADAAYFIKYTRPGNIGTGAASAAKNDQKNAGLDESGKTPRSVSKNMHAIVVFVQAGPTGQRRYKVAKIKTEHQVALLEIGQAFCDKEATLITDQHAGYNFFSAEFQSHHRVNHNEEFMSADGFHTNYAEGFFARVRPCIGGAWHHTSVQYLEEYAWEVAWRQTMVGQSNLVQLEDLIRRVLNSGRATRFADYWNKRQVEKTEAREDLGLVVEVKSAEVPKRRGRPKAGMARIKDVEKPKRAYKRKAPGPTTPPAADE